MAKKGANERDWRPVGVGWGWASFHRRFGWWGREGCAKSSVGAVNRARSARNPHAAWPPACWPGPAQRLGHAPRAVGVDSRLGVIGWPRGFRRASEGLRRGWRRSIKYVKVLADTDRSLASQRLQMMCRAIPGARLIEVSRARSPGPHNSSLLDVSGRCGDVGIGVRAHHGR